MRHPSHGYIFDPLVHELGPFGSEDVFDQVRVHVAGAEGVGADAVGAPSAVEVSLVGVWTDGGFRGVGDGERRAYSVARDFASMTTAAFDWVAVEVVYREEGWGFLVLTAL